MSTTSTRSTQAPIQALTKYMSWVSTNEDAQTINSTANGTGPARECNRPSRRATSGPVKSHTPLRFPLFPASEMTWTIGPNAATVR